MARTSRDSTPAASFDALDNIDIDDMFLDEGDDLFDGLADDLGLDQMGDITNDMCNTKAEGDEITVVEATTGDKPLPTAVEAPAVNEAPKRRKTKRKPRSPVLLDEEEESNELPARKKRRSTKSGSTKKKSSKKDRNELKMEASRKTKLKGVGVLPTAVSRNVSSTSRPSAQSLGTAVAAAGQFGGRQKRGHFSLPLSRSNSDRHKPKSRGSLRISSSAASVSAIDKIKAKKGATSVTDAPELSIPKNPSPFLPPRLQSLFCGMRPSCALFYPFMPALPAEPSLKTRKQYPVIDRLHMSFMGHVNEATKPSKDAFKSRSGLGGAFVFETESIHRLMDESLKDINPPAASAHDDKRAAIGNAVGSLRQTVTSMEKPNLAVDLFCACALLKRQHDFLQQNLKNMEGWCKENFSELEYAATYDIPGIVTLRDSRAPAASDTNVSMFKHPLIKVKLKCVGFKEQKLSDTLFALLPLSLIPNVSSLGDSSKEKKPSRKRKSASLEPSLLVLGSVVTQRADEVFSKTYSELRPGKRRPVISDHVAQTAKDLEVTCISRTASFCQAIERRYTELKKMVQEDEVLIVHTAALWHYVEKAGVFSDLIEEDLDDTLRNIWSPEHKQHVARRPPIQCLEATMQEGDVVRETRVESLFDGLHSLLVEASPVDENDEAQVEEDKEWLDGNFDESLQRLDPRGHFGGCVDISVLSLDERAYVHLRKTGMLEKQPSPLLAEINLSKGVASISTGSTQECLVTKDTAVCSVDVDQFEGIIQPMCADLLKLNKANNLRASFLESAALARRWTAGTWKLDQESALLAKSEELLKQSKESKMISPKASGATKGEYALPW